MQYRYGRKNNVELAYPEFSVKPVAAFTGGTMMFSGGGGAWLRFSKSPFRYTIFTGIGKWGRGGSPAEVAGIAVENDGREFANFPCRAPAESRIGPDFFEKLGLNRVDNGFDIPEAFFPKRP
jgi:hypothetical protein